MKKRHLSIIIAAPFLRAALLCLGATLYFRAIKIRAANEREARLNSMSELAVTLLEERYGEPFVSTEFHNVTTHSGATLYYSGTCAPARDESLKFHVDMEMGEDREYHLEAEHYAAQTANRELSREISEELADLWGNFRVECEIISVGAKNGNDETTIQAMKDGTFDWHYYFEHCATVHEQSGGYRTIEMYILVDDSSVGCSPGEEYDAIVKAVEKYREILSPLDIRFSVHVYTAPGEIYGKCVNILDSHRYAYVSVRYLDIYDVIENDGRGHLVWMNDEFVSNGEPWTLDKQGYIEKRTAVFAESAESDK